MSNIHLTKDYTDEAIKLRHQERFAAVLEDAGFAPDDKDSFWTLDKDVRWGVLEAMRKDYCIAVALREDDKKKLKQLLSV